MPIGSTANEKHLYHESAPAVVVYTKQDEEKYLLLGYREEYIPQEYPKVIVTKRCEQGFPSETRTAKNAEEEAAITASLAPVAEEK